MTGLSPIPKWLMMFFIVKHYAWKYGKYALLCAVVILIVLMMKKCGWIG